MASLYTAHQPDEAGTIHYSDEEHGTWQILIARQLAALEGKACDEYQAGLARLDLPRDRIPQLAQINGVANVHEAFNVAPSVQQKLETKIQESSAFLRFSPFGARKKYKRKDAKEAER